MPYLVHAIVDTSAPELGAEVSDVVRGDVADGLQALATPVEGRVRPTRELLQRHAAVNDAAARRTAVAPLRFGHVVDDLDDLREGPLGERADALRSTLDRVRDLTETRVRVRFVEQEAIATVAAHDPDVRRLRGRQDREARIELGVAVSRGLEQLRTRVSDRLVDRLVPLVEDHRVHDRRDDLDVLDVSVLHTPGDDDHIVAALDDALSGAPATAEVTGPLPPYSFAEVT